MECFFDYSSPWTYLAFSQVQDLVNRHPDVELVYKPILVGGIFNKVNPSVYEARQATPVKPKVAYGNKDLQEWAAAYGLQICNPYDPDPEKRAKPFPVNSVKALRGASFAQQAGQFLNYSYRVFHAYWGQGRDISQDAELHSIAAESGLNADAFMTYLATPEAKKLVVDNTDEVMQRGGYGSPTFFVNGSNMYFGNDRLLLLERQIMLERGQTPIGFGQWKVGGKSPIANL